MSAAAPTVRQRKSSGPNWRAGDTIAGYAFIAPAIIIFLAFVIIPLVYALYLSLFKVNILNYDQQTFVGFSNFGKIASDSEFQRALWNTTRFSLIVVPCQTILALALALIANAKIPGRTFFRTAFFFPSISSSAVISVIFLWVFNKFGLLNHLLAAIHLIPNINAGNAWVDNPNTALESIMGLNIWTTAGTMMVVFLAALQGIPAHLYEAAKLDGANAAQSFWGITLPLLAPTTFFIVTLGLIGTFQVFDQAFIISNGGGGPAYSTLTAVFYIYREAFEKTNGVGVASAGAIILFIIIFVLTLIQRLFFNKEPEY